MRVLVAPNAFKGTLTAAVAARVIGDALVAHGHDVDLAPMADGGDGTLDAFLAAGFAAMSVEVHDAAGRPHTASVAMRGDTAVVELARTCGMATVPDLPPDPWHASTLGLGEAARAAVDAGARDVVVAVGGSASVDGGVGFLHGLGFVVTDAAGDVVTPDATGMARAHTVSGRAPAGVAWTVLADVDNPLLGPGGALMFAAQKGVPAGDVDVLHRAWADWAAVLSRASGVDVGALPHTGAAGGVSAAAYAMLGARLTSGAHTVADVVGLDRRVRAADLVVTGEGRFDEQSRHGKAPGVVIDLARAYGKPVAVLAGQVTTTLPGAIATADAPSPADPEPALAWATTTLLARLSDAGRAERGGVG